MWRKNLAAGVAVCKCCRIQVLLTDMEMLAPNVNFTAKTLRDRRTNSDSVDVFVGEMPCCAHDRQTSVGFLLVFVRRHVVHMTDTYPDSVSVFVG